MIDGDDGPPDVAEQIESWDEIMPPGNGKSSPEWELRVWSRDVKRSCPKCATTDVRNWNLRWLKKGTIPEIDAECLKVLCIRCGWFFYMQTAEQADKRAQPSGPPPEMLGGFRDTRQTSQQKPDDFLRQRIRHIDPPRITALIDHILGLVDDEGKLVCTFLGETQRALRIALGCKAPNDGEPLPTMIRKSLSDRWK